MLLRSLITKKFIKNNKPTSKTEEDVIYKTRRLKGGRRLQLMKFFVIKHCVFGILEV